MEKISELGDARVGITVRIRAEQCTRMAVRVRESDIISIDRIGEKQFGRGSKDVETKTRCRPLVITLAH